MATLAPRFENMRRNRLYAGVGHAQQLGNIALERRKLLGETQAAVTRISESVGFKTTKDAKQVFCQ